MYYAKNRAAMLRGPVHRDFLKAIDEASPSEDVYLMETEAGDYTLVYKNVPLHSPKGAELEARSMVRKQAGKTAKHHHFILGMGLGYVLQALLEHSEGFAYVYEAELGLLRFVLENVDLSEYLGSGQVVMASTPAQLRELVSNAYSLGDEVDLLYLEGYGQLWKEELPRVIREEIMSVMKAKQASVRTIFEYQKDWNKQFCENAKHLPTAEPFAALQDHFKNRPVIIVSAGPSLDKAIDTLRDMQDEVVIIAVGAALRALADAGISPDFVVFLDYEGPEKQMHGLGNALKNTSMLLGPFVDDCCYTVPANRHFVIHLNNYRDYSVWIGKQIGDLGAEMTSGGTVSMMAFYAGLTMGCNPLIMVGQDLALSGTQMYAGGVSGTFNEHGQLLVEASETVYEKTVNLRDVKGQNGETLKAPGDYAQYITDFAEEARRFRQKKPLFPFYNASVGGAFIDGFEHLPLSEIRKKLHLEAFDKSLPTPSGLTTEEKRKKTLESSKTLLSVIRDCLKMSKEALDYLALLTKGIEADKGGTNYEKRYLIVHREIMKRVMSHNVLSLCLQKEFWLLRQNENTASEVYEDIIENYKLEEQFYTALRYVFEYMEPALAESVEALKAPIATPS